MPGNTNQQNPNQQTPPKSMTYFEYKRWETNPNFNPANPPDPNNPPSIEASYVINRSNGDMINKSSMVISNETTGCQWLNQLNNGSGGWAAMDQAAAWQEIQSGNTTNFVLGPQNICLSTRQDGPILPPTNQWNNLLPDYPGTNIEYDGTTGEYISYTFQVGQGGQPTDQLDHVWKCNNNTWVELLPIPPGFILPSRRDNRNGWQKTGEWMKQHKKLIVAIGAVAAAIVLTTGFYNKFFKSANKDVIPPNPSGSYFNIKTPDTFINYEDERIPTIDIRQIFDVETNKWSTKPEDIDKLKKSLQDGGMSPEEIGKYIKQLESGGKGTQVNAALTGNHGFTIAFTYYKRVKLPNGNFDVIPFDVRADTGSTGPKIDFSKARDILNSTFSAAVEDATGALNFGGASGLTVTGVDGFTVDLAEASNNGNGTFNGQVILTPTAGGSPITIDYIRNDDGTFSVRTVS